MTNTAPKTNTNVILKTQEDWEDWDVQFKGKAVAYGIWPSIDPERPGGPAPFMPEPIEPTVQSYEKKLQGIQTRASSTTAQEERELVDPTGHPNTTSEMTTAGRSAYNTDLGLYYNRCKKYDRQQAAIQELKSWIYTTVNRHWVTTCCNPTESITQWYLNLQQAAGIDPFDQDEVVREKYRAAVQPLTKPPKDINNWISVWEETMTLAEKTGIPETAKAGYWFRDFIKALSQIYDNWATPYAVQKRPEAKNGTLEYRTVSNDFRDHIRDINNQKTRKVARGAFGPTFAGQPDEPDDQAGTGKNTGPDRTNRPSKRRYTGGDQSGCWACSQLHSLARCYYAFPDNAPSWFEPREHLQKKVKEALESDEQLRKEVTKLQGKKTRTGRETSGSRSSASKTSSTTASSRIGSPGRTNQAIED